MLAILAASAMLAGCVTDQPVADDGAGADWMPKEWQIEAGGMGK
jgi:hypothetical protein